MAREFHPVSGALFVGDWANGNVYRITAAGS